MIRACIAITAALLATPAASQSLTLGNLKAPIARASGKAPAKSMKDLWTQINGLPAARPPVPPAPAGKPIMAAEGDSITLMWGGSYPGIYAASHPAVDVRGFAVGGARISDPTGGNGLVQRQAKVIAAKPALVTILIGANDLGDGSYGTPQDWLKALWSYTAALKASGAKVAVGTVLPICLPNLADYNQRHRERRPIVNEAIRAAAGAQVDAVIDFAADPVMGPDLAACDLKLFKDGLHPTEGALPAGQGRLAAIYARTIDTLLAGSPPRTGDAVDPPLGGTVTKQPDEIASNFDTSRYLTAAWETGVLGAIPPSAAPDNVGAFRFICKAGQVRRDDPIVFPGQPGKSHLHQFFGNLGADAFSTWESLRTTGDSSCMNMLNRSAYWMPAMLSGEQVVVPDYVSIYYKRRPSSDPECQRMGKACVALPRGLRFIFGFDMVTDTQPTGAGYFNCQGPGATQGHYKDITTAVAFCPVGSQIGATINAPNCWDGKRLDSPNHRDHVAYTSYGDWGYERCPPTHPYVVPTFTMGSWYTVPAAGAASLYLSSDEMPGMPRHRPGSTFHADWFGAWDEPTLRLWTANCIDKMLNCSGGDLGNGQQMVQVGPMTFRADPALVPIPPL